MAILKMVIVAVVVMEATLGGKKAGAQVHHVVGGDQGWDPSSDVASWSSGRSFSVGDKIWFAYSAAEESIAELNSKEEYESCDVSNPLRMYTDGLNGIPLDGEGIRYFVSSKAESCKNGLKLHVEVGPLGNTDAKMPKVAVAAAAPPTTPSGSVRLHGSSVLLLVGLWLCVRYMAI
ncbi:tropinone reductase-like protein [Hibiscus syriacus]|uniref:Tropinone reductase-like protein n=1 Tax=Hibiscus syriacus TaxID=106335 RepID=A0A6A3BI65_HIBSY|nr:mavicyanin-like [Hibiscus syriacus]KAE8715601.1 tropinone reductase-like protein [Hibiscus syriacus]